MSRIFISYRRDDSHDASRMIYERLGGRFGRHQVFFDKEGLKPGVNFARALRERLQACEVLLVMIGKDWLHCTDDDGERRGAAASGACEAAGAAASYCGQT